MENINEITYLSVIYFIRLDIDLRKNAIFCKNKKLYLNRIIVYNYFN